RRQKTCYVSGHPSADSDYCAVAIGPRIHKPPRKKFDRCDALIGFRGCKQNNPPILLGGPSKLHRLAPPERPYGFVPYPVSGALPKNSLKTSGDLLHHISAYEYFRDMGSSSRQGDIDFHC